MINRIALIYLCALVAVIGLVAWAGSQNHQVATSDVHSGNVNDLSQDGEDPPNKASTKSCIEDSRAGRLCDPFHFRNLSIMIVPVSAEQVFLLDQGTVTPFTNKTGYIPRPGADLPLGNCYVYDRLRSGDNAPLLSCTTIETGNQRRIFPLDPIALQILPEYTGTLAEDSEPIATTYGVYGDTPYHDYGVSNKGMYAETDEGVYYFTNTDDRTLYFTRDRFASSQIIARTESIRVIHTFSSP